MEFVPKKSLYNNIQTKHTYMCRTTSGSIIVDGRGLWLLAEALNVRFVESQAKTRERNST